MDDLIAWLRAQLDEDERVARQLMAEPGGFYLEAETEDTNIMTVGAHVHRWEPKRVLAEVEAKRRILDAWGPPGGYADGIGDAIHAIAQPYAGRPGWRPEWAATRPE